MPNRQILSRLLLAALLFFVALRFGILAAQSLTPSPAAEPLLVSRPMLLIAAADYSPPPLAAVHPGVIAAFQIMVSLTALVAFPGRTKQNVPQSEFQPDWVI